MILLELLANEAIDASTHSSILSREILRGIFHCHFSGCLELLQNYLLTVNREPIVSVRLRRLLPNPS